MMWMKADPALDARRRIERFQTVLTRVGLAWRGVQF